MSTIESSPILYSFQQLRMTSLWMLEVSWNGEVVQNMKQSLDSDWKRDMSYFAKVCYFYSRQVHS